MYYSYSSILKALFLLLVISGFKTTVCAVETTRPGKRGIISGTIIDSESEAYIEYATVALYKMQPKALISGGITDNKGFFELKDIANGEYALEITFMGFKTRNISPIVVSDSSHLVALGTIKLEASINKIDDVNVVADKASIEYKIDKRVVNVSQQLTAQSGTAVDILENVPSIKVDIEGNVSLRGSESFTVLIDGRPTALAATDALKQIPASAIENIEIITNPSAKYEPDGTAGIVNIITKKNSLEGLSGIVNASIGLQNKYSTDFTLDKRSAKWHYYLGADFGHEENPGGLKSEMWTGTFADTINYTNTKGDFTRLRESYGINGGIDYALNPKINFGLLARYGQNAHGRNAKTEYEQFTSVSSDTLKYFGSNDDQHGGSFYSLGLFYKQLFNRKEHYLEFQANTDGRNGDEFSKNELKTTDRVYQGRKSAETGPSQTIRMQLDYVRPLGGTQKIETGLQGMFAPSIDKNDMEIYDTVSGSYVSDPLYTTTTDYTRKTFSIYGIYSGEWVNIGYQLGVRGEYTYQYMKLKETNESFMYEKPGLFPTLHLSYQLPSNQQMMASYTRRINRANPWQLEPFVTWMDAYNMRKGNPELKPEFINSVDFGYQKKIGTNFISLDAYYRTTENKIERVQRDTLPNIILNSFENIGTDYSLGAELSFNVSLFKWYQLNLMGDLYNYKKTGTLYGKDFSRESFNWSARVNNVFRVTPLTRVQADLNYRSASITSQGKEAAFVVASIAMKQELLDRKLSATLQFRNILGTAKRESTNQSTTFYSYNQFSPNWPIVTLTLSYKINNYKVKRQSNGVDYENDYDGGE